MSSLSGIVGAEQIITNGLVLNLDAGNPSSYSGTGTTWTDLSGNANNGTLISSPTYDSNNKGSIVFNGSSSYATVVSSSSLNLPNNITVSAWVYNSVWKEANIIEGNSSNVPSGYNGFMLWTTPNYSNKMVWGRQSGAPQLYSADNFNTRVNVWYNIVGTSDGTTLRLYYNATLDSSLVGTPNFVNAGTVRIANGADGLFNGKIGSISIYNRALSLAEISQNFNALRGRYSV